jgi:hypothetical protein
MNMKMSAKAEKEITSYVDSIVANNQWDGEDDWFDYEYDGQVVDINIWRDDDNYIRATVYPTIETPNGLTTDTDVWYNLENYN